MSNTSTRPIVQRATSVIKSRDGEPWTAYLDRLTCIVGESGRGYKGEAPGGKSTILGAVTYALAGYIDDVQGRRNSKDNDLILAHGPLRGAPGDHVWAEVEIGTAGLDCGDIVKRGIQRLENGTATADDLIDPAGWAGPKATVLHLDDVDEAMRAGGEKGRRLQLQWICGTATRADVLALLPDDLASSYVEMAGEASGNGVDELQRVSERAKTKASKAKKDREAEEAKVRAARSLGASRVTPAQLTAAREAVQAATTERDAAVAAHGAASAAAMAQQVPAVDWADIRRKRNAAAEQVSTAAADVAKARADLAAIPPDPDPLHPSIVEDVRALRRILDRGHSTNLEGCPVCEGPAPDWTAKIKTLDALIRSRMPNPDRAPTAARLADAEQRWQAAQNLLNSLPQVPAGAGEEGPAGPTTVTVAPTPADLRKAVEEAAARVELASSALTAATLALHQLESAESAWTKTSEARTAADRASVLEKDYARLHKACDDAAADLIRQSIDAFVQRVQRYVPRGWEFGAVVPESRRAPPRFGFMTTLADGSKVLDIAISGAEWSDARMAITCAIVDGLEGLVVVIPEERDVSPRVRSEMMRALRRTSAQVLLTSTVKPWGACAGWKVMTVDELWAEGAAQSAAPQSGEGSTGTDDEEGSAGADDDGDSNGSVAAPPAPIPQMPTAPPAPTVAPPPQPAQQTLGDFAGAPPVAPAAPTPPVPSEGASEGSARVVVID